MTCMTSKWSIARRRSGLLLDFHVNNESLHSLQGLSGFDDLRRYIKHGNEFCKELANIIQERSDLELIYAKGLNKIAARLQKLATTCISSSTLCMAWTGVATAMEQEAELHKNLSVSMAEDLYKPLKTLSETVHKNRKPVEAYVDRSMKNVLDRRSDEYKCKRTVFSLARETERLYDQTLDAKAGKGKMTEKDSNKLDKKSRGSEELLRKADKEYCEACMKAEVSRQEWHFAVHKGSYQLYKIEESRLSELQDVLNKYNNHIAVLAPESEKIHARMNESIMSLDPETDIKTVRETKRPDLSQSEQVLLECYAEDMSSKMNSERRLHALNVYTYFLQMDIEKEKKGQEGVEKLLEVYQSRPHFADAQTQEDVKQKLISGESMMNYLAASYEKISTAIATANSQPPPSPGKFNLFITKTKDKMGLPVTLLRIPEQQRKEQMSMLHVYQEMPIDRAPPVGEQANYSTIDVGGSDHDSDDEDAFDDNENSAATTGHSPNHHMGQCKAIYNYQAVRQDELDLKAGDVITILHKEASGWWLGDLNGKTGLFPATYVE